MSRASVNSARSAALGDPRPGGCTGIGPASLRNALAVALVLGSAGCPTRPAHVPADAAALAALDPALAGWSPFAAAAGHERIQVAWNDGQAVPLHFLRAVEGWERLGDGAAWARTTVVLDHPRRKDVYLVEWLRPAGDRILCARRQVGATALDIDPPQPTLVAPITSGANWTWSGTVGGIPARAEFRVTRLDASPAEGAAGAAGLTCPVARIEQTTTVDGLSCTSARVYAWDVGVIDEQGTFPVNEPSTAEDRMRAFRADAPAPGD